jgi:hypothetical protein
MLKLGVAFARGQVATFEAMSDSAEKTSDARKMAELLEYVVNVLLRQRCVSGRAAAATVRGRQPKRIKLCPEPNSPLPTSISYDIS